MRRIEDLIIPEHLRYMVKPSMTYRRREEIVIGGDTETIEGRPLSFQFYSEDIELQEILWPTPANAMEKFIGFLDKLPDDEIYSIYVHNLKFDLIEFFYPIWMELTDELDFTYGQWHITGVYQRPSFLRMKSASKTVYLLDSMLWFITSLDNAADLVCPDLPKLTQPKGLGSKRFKKGDSVYEAYAMRDAEVCYHLGKAIQAMHREFEIPQSVSLASMSATIFKKDFLTYDIPQPQIECIKASYNSYHGGKNNLYPGAAPAWHRNMAALDVSSAYPFAMSTMPAFSNLKQYKVYKAKKPARYRVPPWGVYLITGVVERECPWPSLFDHGFKPIRGPGFVDSVWVHGLELNEALEHREFTPLVPIEGFYYDHDRDKRKPALKGFVDHFYELKNTATNKVQRYTYKIILNSLYGKFIQRREVDLSDDPDQPEKALLAGGLFHPFIASGITAHTRAYMHRLEHRFQAIHTATDGIYTKNHKNIEREVAASNKAEKVDQLGRLEFEGKGDLLLLRNKLYVLYSKSKADGPASSEFKGRYIMKAALHGYQGTLQQLEHMVATGKRDYTVTKPNTLKDSQNRGLEPNKFIDRDFTLNIESVKT